MRFPSNLPSGWRDASMSDLTECADNPRTSHSRQLRSARPCKCTLAPARYPYNYAAPLRQARRRVTPRQSIGNLDPRAK